MSRDRAGVIIVHEKKILLMYRKKNNAEYYCIPGGHIEPKETAKEAAIREIKEETTLDVKLVDFMVELENQGRKETYFFAKSFLGSVKLSGEERERNSPSDMFKLEWIDKEKLSELLIYPKELGLKLDPLIATLQSIQ